jgi:hypothetical protein
MTSTLAWSESSQCLHVGIPKALVYAAPVDSKETLHTALWTTVRLPAIAPSSPNGCGGP